jgi:hypothetical protein
MEMLPLKATAKQSADRARAIPRIEIKFMLSVMRSSPGGLNILKVFSVAAPILRIITAG